MMIKIAMIPVYISMWIARLCLEIPLWLIGIPLVWTMAHLKLYYYRPSKYFYQEGRRFGKPVLVWKGGWLTWLWGNEEDGIDGRWFNGGLGFENNKPLAKRIFDWAALRNPVSNLRFVPFINLKIDPKKIYGAGNCMHPTSALRKFRLYGGMNKGPALWSFAAQGPFAGLSIKKPTSRTTHHRFLIGFKIYPEDAFISPHKLVNTSRYPRCGFGLQLTFNQKE